MPLLRGKTAILLSYLQILTQSEQLQSKMQQLEQAVAQGSLQLVADLSFQCRDHLSQLDNLPSLHLMRARIEMKRRALLTAFGSLQGVRDATVEQVAALDGFSQASAERLVAALRGDASSPS